MNKLRDLAYANGKQEEYDEYQNAKRDTYIVAGAFIIGFYLTARLFIDVVLTILEHIPATQLDVGELSGIMAIMFATGAYFSLLCWWLNHTYDMIDEYKKERDAAYKKITKVK
jgi:hypothetical protein